MNIKPKTLKPNTMKRLSLILICVTIAAMSAMADDIIKVCGQNVQNFFYSLDRNRTTDNNIPVSNYNTVEGRTAKLNAIISALAPYEADIYTFNEVECCEEVMTLLAESMSAATGKNYAAVKDGLSYNKSSYPDGVLKAGFIYNTATIKPYGSNVGTGNGYFYTRFMRMQAFESKTSGERFTLSMNHFKSGDVAENGEARIDNAQSLLTNLSGALDPDILIMGDLNSEMGEACLDLIVNAGYDEQIIKYAGPYAYTHCWDGGEIIDHAFANGTMAKQITTATVMPIANPCSVTDYSKAYSDHNPYMVTLSLGNNGHTAPQYVRAKTVTAGNKYAMVGTLNGGLEAALALAANYTYGYLKTQTVTEEAGVIETVPSSMLFEFADAGDGLFYIKDCNGRYIYSDKRDNGTYYSTFSMTPDIGAAHTFTVTPEADGTFKIQNTTNDYFIQATIYEGAGEFGLWNYQGTDRYLPFLYEELNTTGITTINHEPLTTDHYYNLAGQRITRPTKGIYILNGKKIFFK